MKIEKVFKKRKRVIDIILLTYNKIECTKKCLEHIFKNTSPFFSLTIFDNYSTDGTVEFLKSFAYDKDNINLILSNKNCGIIEGRNRANKFLDILGQRSDYLFILDNDQFVQASWLNSYMSFMDKYDIVGMEGWEMRKDFYPIRRAKKKNDIYHYVSCCGMMIKNEVVKKIGLFDEKFSPMFFEDPCFCFRAIDKGYKVCRNTDFNVIFHEPHSLLGDNGEKRRYFLQSWEYFKKKYKNRKLLNLLHHKGGGFSGTTD